MELTFKTYSSNDKKICLALFDLNCPEYFAPNERRDYDDFLNSNPGGYELCIWNRDVVGAFGLSKEDNNRSRLNWFQLNNKVHGIGIGSIIMNRVLMQANDSGINVIFIPTSHKSFKFFEKKGAIKISEIENGWRPNMHRIDMELHL